MTQYAPLSCSCNALPPQRTSGRLLPAPLGLCSHRKSYAADPQLVQKF
jgi:hypothetical protein